MSDYERQVRNYFGGKHHIFEEILQQVNRQALAPFFRPRLRRTGRVLEAGCGSGHLAGELGLRNACFVDIAWEQIDRFRNTGTPGRFIEGDLKMLPFKDNAFDEVICSNVLHYTGRPGLVELFRVTKPGGQMLVAFFEDSDFSRSACRLAVFWGLFPPLMRDARFIGLTDLAWLNLRIEDNATIVFLPPLFQARRELPRQGFVAFVLRKERINNNTK